jgi:hypothetical protein
MNILKLKQYKLDFFYYFFNIINNIIMFNEFIYELPIHKRIIIIGDVHGDIKRFKNILINKQIINNDLEWIARPPETIIVQLGDQIDSLNRNTNEDWEVLKDYEMIYFTEHLNLIARSKGGYCISLIGNHELMNVIGDFSYVSKKSITDTRTQMFKPKGSMALILAKRPIILKIGDLLFCHAKLDLSHLKILQKHGKDLCYINQIWKKLLENETINVEDKEIIDNIIIGSGGILWNRMENNKETTATLFNELGITYMFLGHTTYDKIQLKDNQIWYCDTGLSRSFGKKTYQFLEIRLKTINIETINDE